MVIDLFWPFEDISATTICEICILYFAVYSGCHNYLYTPLNPIVNKSCKIECCGNLTHPIIQNDITTRGLEL